MDKKKKKKKAKIKTKTHDVLETMKLRQFASTYPIKKFDSNKDIDSDFESY